jgi:Glyoxalase-like domain
VWPAQADGQNATQHLDIHVLDLDAATTHALNAGATLADFQPQETVRVLFDPAGHPFCLFT